METMTTDDVVSAMGALVFAVVRRLPAGDRQAFASDLGRLARAEHAEGRAASSLVLVDLQRAAELAST